MTAAHLTQLWKWVSLACFGYVASSVLTLQGAADILGTKLIAREDHGLAVFGYFAVIVGGALMCLGLAIAITYARRHGTAWHDRIPVIMLDGLQTGSVEGKLFQAAVVFYACLFSAVRDRSFNAGGKQGANLRTGHESSRCP
jgi:hypothetical protein